MYKRLTPVIPERGRLRQENCHEFWRSLGYSVRPYQKNKNKQRWGQERQEVACKFEDSLVHVVYTGFQSDHISK